MIKTEVIVPDTSVIAEGIISKYIAEKKLQIKKIIIPEAVVNELEHQANQGRETGLIGIEEISRLRKLNVKLEFAGKRPNEFEIKYAKSGAVDNIIREVARENNAMLITADRVQALVASAYGIKVELIEFGFDNTKIKDPLAELFDEKTMSVHLKEESKTIAKKGKPGAWEFVETEYKPSRKELQELAKEIVSQCQLRNDSFIEIERSGSTIAQLNNYRIVITKPPFASCWEITAVRPVARLTLEDYEFPEKFKARLEQKAEGILVAGSPGEGKSTFTQALGEFYSKKGKIVKTVEAPRDLVLPDTITQYSASHGSHEEIRDVLLLNRPDYTIYDEIRNNSDFLLFSDMRMAGIGMIGVIHASAAVDAIQRFIGRVEMGLVPQIVDTVVYIKAGKIHTIYSLEMVVKIPVGMNDEDLARPVILVKDFYKDKPEFEIYTYGDNVVVIPVKEDNKKKNPLFSLAEEGIKEQLSAFTSRAEVEVVSEHKAIIYVPDNKISQIIGKGGDNIRELEKALGIKLDVQPLKEDSKSIRYEATVRNKNIVIKLPSTYANQEVDLYYDNKYLLTVKTSKNAQIKVSTSNNLGKELKKAIDKNKLVVSN